ncbi:hypothetical protein PENSPDRAFT_654366 [Peniophora sp. CONT]|nr:hypothetical protein PENSPDRAFT_654366 [Peniophora sp. CONT]
MHSSAITFGAAALFLTAAPSALAAGPRPECTYEVNTIKPTDTCSTISAWSEVSVSTIESLNPGIECNTPGMGVSSVCLQQILLPCTLNATAWESTCNDLAGEYQLSTDQFVQLNDNVNAACSNLIAGEPYCVSTAECYPGNHVPYC